MEDLLKKSFSYSFTTTKKPAEVYATLLDIKKWWSGLYAENIEGLSNKVDDEFSFRAGGGAHYSKQKLIEAVPCSKIVWLVTDSNLSFASKPDEWTNTKLVFNITEKGDKTELTFTHQGLVPQFECYDNCSAAWANYLDMLEKAMN